MLLLEKNRNNSLQIPSKAGSFFYSPIVLILLIGTVFSATYAGPCCSKSATPICHETKSIDNKMRRYNSTGAVIVHSDPIESQSTTPTPDGKSFDSSDDENTASDNESLTNYLPLGNQTPTAPCNSPASVQSPEAISPLPTPQTPHRNPRMQRLLTALNNANSDSVDAPF